MNTNKSTGSYTIGRVRRKRQHTDVETDLISSPKTKDNPLMKTPVQSPKSAPSDNVKDTTATTLDNNDKIIDMLKSRASSYDNCETMLSKINKRLDFGRQKYGHGVIIDDDTTKYASNWDPSSAQNWLIMALEEMLDGCVYMSAELLRAERQKISSKYITKLEKSLKYCIKSTDLLLSAEDE